MDFQKLALVLTEPTWRTKSKQSGQTPIRLQRARNRMFDIESKGKNGTLRSYITVINLKRQQ